MAPDEAENAFSPIAILPPFCGIVFAEYMLEPFPIKGYEDVKAYEAEIIPVNPLPSPIKLPVKDPVLYDPVKALKEDVVTNEPVSICGIGKLARLLPSPENEPENEPLIEYDPDESCSGLSIAMLNC
jgi:hypothetical protein